MYSSQLNPDTLTIPEAIDRARKRGDHALCDMLIGCWMLHCVLFEQALLPDLVGLTQHINALPLDHRSSAYAVLGLLKREAVDNDRLRREMDALLSWLPVVDIAPPEDVEAFMQDVFSPQLWGMVSKEEKDRLLLCEGTFLNLRRLSPHERQAGRIRSLIVDWSAVAERCLARARSSLQRSPQASTDPLGVQLRNSDDAFKKASRACKWEHRPRIVNALHGLNILWRLNHFNIQGGKHLGGDAISWEHVVEVHGGLYWALRALLDVANLPPLEKY